MLKRLLILLVCVIVFFPVASHSAYFSEHDADILYWHEETNGKHYYYYHVTNLSSESTIVAVYIGYDWEHGIPLLNRTRAETAHVPLKFFSPPGWTGKVQYTEETLYYDLEWETGDPSKNIKPGESSYRFGVELTSQRDDHINTNFTVIYGDSTVATKALSGSETEAPPKNHILSPLYLLLLSKGIDVKFARLNSAG
ncbi:MAG: hypothetical protein WGN25_10895 [Candidatus Electrothrix sp. GW3-4]|uniref:hypothetical protein n=1 Tax=Candidatus Electrothrix sp. GW3-4 TaxID=3126740 RepID=UPI0030D106AD